MALIPSTIAGYVEVEGLAPDERAGAIKRFRELGLATESPAKMVIGEMTPEQLAVVNANQNMLFTRNRFAGVMNA